MVDEARPYAIHSDSECDRREKQAVLAGLEITCATSRFPRRPKSSMQDAAQARWRAALPHTLRTRQ